MTTTEGPRGARALGLLAALLAAAPAGAGDVFRGKSLYEQHCAACHGATGRPVMPGAPHFERGEGLYRPDVEIYETVRAGRNAMPGYRGRLENEEILDVLAYIRTLH